MDMLRSQFRATLIITKYRGEAGSLHVIPFPNASISNRSVDGPTQYRGSHRDKQGDLIASKGEVIIIVLRRYNVCFLPKLPQSPFNNSHAEVEDLYLHQALTI